IEYSNDPASNGTGTTKEDKTYTYTFNFDIEKVNAVDHNDKLKGAQFELQRENGTKINLVKVSDGVFRPAKGTETVADDKTVVTDNNGKLQFTGLKEGTYKVKEIKAPTGYNLLKDPITVTISATYDENTGILESWKVNNANAQGTTVPVITVENNKGVTLPETGGMGTVLFTVFGVAIVALGATWYVKSNRKSRHAA
ncbi:SpaA isopeptide-forming pilin-related protein, partial [Bifidobacterium longum]